MMNMENFFIGLNNNINIEAIGMTTPSISRMTSTATSRSHSPDRDIQLGIQVKQFNNSDCFNVRF